MKDFVNYAKPKESEKTMILCPEAEAFIETLKELTRITEKLMALIKDDIILVKENKP